MRTIPHQPLGDPTRVLVSTAIMAQFRTAFRELRCMSGDRMRRTELSFTNTHILSMLDRHGEMPMSRLAEMLDVSLSNASGVVDRLEDRGFVERFRVPGDRRVVLVRPTDQGRAALTRAEVLKDDLILRILDRLDDRRLRRLAVALDDVRGAAAEVFASDPELGRHEHIPDHLPDQAHPGHHGMPVDHELAVDPASPA
jgi:DNA-binding MarR family transcriptional regulator